MPELLANHEQIEQKNLNPDELNAIQDINKFLSDNEGTDQAIVDKLKKEDWEWIPDAIKESYETIKNDISFSDAYTPEEYDQHKNNIINYLANNFGHMNQRAEGLDFSALNTTVLESKLFNYNKTQFDKDKTQQNLIDIPRFMTNHKADYINNALRTETIVKTPAEIPEYNKEQEHVIGKIFEVPQEEKNHILNLVQLVKSEQGTFNLEVFGQSDGTPVRNPKFIGQKYNDLRNELLEWCNPSIQENLIAIFPEFNSDNFPDKDSWNVAFAKTRAMAKLSFISPEDKNILLQWSTTKWDNKTKIWSTTFAFNTVENQGHEHTLWRVKLTNNLEKQTEDIVTYLDHYIQNISVNSIWFSIEYPDHIKNEWTINGRRQLWYINWSTPATRLVSDFWLSADFMINTWNNREEPNVSINREFTKEWGTKAPETLTPRSSGDYRMNIVLNYADIINGKYDEYFDYTRPDWENITREIKLKDNISFADGLTLFKSMNKNTSAETYANNVWAELHNLQYLESQINNNFELRTWVATAMFDKRSTYVKQNPNNYENTYYTMLQWLWVDISKNTTTDGRQLISFNLQDKNSGKIVQIWNTILK